MQNLGILLIVGGILVVVIGRFFPGFGHLPGDFTFSGKGWTLYVPLTTGIIISLLASIFFKLFSKP